MMKSMILSALVCAVTMPLLARGAILPKGTEVWLQWQGKNIDGAEFTPAEKTFRAEIKETRPEPLAGNCTWYDIWCTSGGKRFVKQCSESMIDGARNYAVITHYKNKKGIMTPLRPEASKQARIIQKQDEETWLLHKSWRKQQR